MLPPNHVHQWRRGQAKRSEASTGSRQSSYTRNIDSVDNVVQSSTHDAPRDWWREHRVADRERSVFHTTSRLVGVPGLSVSVPLSLHVPKRMFHIP